MDSTGLSMQKRKRAFFVLLCVGVAFTHFADGKQTVQRPAAPPAADSAPSRPVSRLVSRAGGAAKARRVGKQLTDDAKVPRPPDSEELTDRSSAGNCASGHCPTRVQQTPRRRPEMLSTAVLSRGAVTLTDDNYNDFMAAHSIVLVLYYAPWCYWSQQTTPEFDAAARVLAHDKGDPPVFLAKVDCTQHTQVMKKEDIQEYPTLKFFIDGHAREYTGGRKRAEILRWLQENLNRDRIIASVNALEEVLANRQLGTLVVIAAHELPPAGLLNSPGGSSGGSASPHGNRETPEQTEKQQRRVLRLGVVKWETDPGEAPSDHSQDSLGAANVGSFDTGLSRRFRVAGQNREASAESQELSPGRTRYPTKRFDRDTFVRVSRMMGDDVLFGEISDPEVVEYYLDVHVRPYMQTRLEMAHTHLPFIAAFPSESDKDDLENNRDLFASDAAREEVVVYTGALDDEESLLRFVRTHKFPPALPFTGIVAPRIFEDGRPICILFLEVAHGHKGFEKASRSQVQGVKKVFEQFAIKYRSDIIFTISGTEEPHEKRLLTLLGVDDDASSPQLRIVTFNPSGNGKYYPALKFRPESDRVPRLAGGTSLRLAAQPLYQEPRQQEKEPDSASPHRTGLRVSGLPASERISGSATAEPIDRAEGLRGSGDTGERTDEDPLVSFGNQLDAFVTAYINGSLTPYLRSEPAPADEENSGLLKVVVGSTFNKLVLENDRDVLVEFGAPWCGHCRKVEPTLKMVASVLHDLGSEVVVAKMDATRNEVRDLYFSGYPTLLLFPANRKGAPVMYQGDRTEDDLLQWLADNAEKANIDLEVAKDRVHKLVNQNSLLSSAISESGESPGVSKKSGSRPGMSVLEEL
ncbi:protein disulfide-isomerase [Cystoisospora suis]|uniref:Protein disulfide-isomerase n=1 Tax=Cystoisospora suis TaxID=483139 RepID=A0A2C6L9U8_9APIC|nr:protein disulfide-isomerase [Cystoisospora suis]